MLLFEEIEANNINERNINNPDFFHELNKTYKRSFNSYQGCSLSFIESKSSISKNKNNEESSIYIHGITNISYLFSGCISLNYIPDLSKLDTSNFFKINKFEECNSLISLPDIYIKMVYF